MKVGIRFSTERVSEPIISAVVLEKKAKINILRAQVSESGGRVLVEVPDNQADEIIKAFRELGALVDVGKVIEILEDKCIDCGHCITICPVDAIFFEEDFSVKLEEQKCIQCGSCVDACPTRAIKLYGE